jgi:hypothetical protein
MITNTITTKKSMSILMKQEDVVQLINKSRKKIIRKIKIIKILNVTIMITHMIMTKIIHIAIVNRKRIKRFNIDMIIMKIMITVSILMSKEARLKEVLVATIITVL